MVILFTIPNLLGEEGDEGCGMLLTSSPSPVWGRTIRQPPEFVKCFHDGRHTLEHPPLIEPAALSSVNSNVNWRDSENGIFLASRCYFIIFLNFFYFLFFVKAKY